MIHSYNQDRQEIVTPSVDSETIEGHNNPLALLRYKGTAGGEVMDIVEEQEKEAPPYDITDGGFSTTVNIASIMQLNPSYGGQNADGSLKPAIPTLKSTTLFVPAGILKMNVENVDDGASILIDVVGTVLCKDMAS